MNSFTKDAAEPRLQIPLHQHGTDSASSQGTSPVHAMSLSADKIVLIARQLQIGELRHLAAIAEFVEVVGLLIHRLQSERGASSIYLGSAGQRFEDMRREQVAAAQVVDAELRRLFEQQLKQAAFGSAKLLNLMAWVLIGLDELPELRSRIERLKLGAADAIAAYSRLIAGLISLIFELADIAIDPRISSLLVALFNLVQAKEFAGQERAVGALSFASGHCDGAHQQRIVHLIETQDRHFQLFAKFAPAPLAAREQEIQDAGYAAPLERLRRLLCSGKAGAALDTDLSDKWFEVCSERLTAIWSLQCALVDTLKQRCATLIDEAQSELQDAEGMLKRLRDNPPPQAGLADRFFDPAVPVESALHFASGAAADNAQNHTIIDLLQSQSKRLATMESELAAARRALDERKIIERAKGILMARFNLSEEDAYKRLRTASMEQNRRLAELAEALVSLSAI